MTGDGRPDPQALLTAIQKLDRKKGRGRLRIFLGMCPGVGKTYSMLKAAREQQNRGVKVAIGLIETHGRRETEELVMGLQQFPRLEKEYKGSILTEMDIDAILKDPPQLLLVDELAHTNTPGSRHLKRHQDVEELLMAGIDIYTTINIQHIESRNDQVAQITSIQVKETVPDSLVASADQIELIDLSPGELLQRLKEGKVYMGERAVHAATGFFKEEHLTALRELALRFTAEKVDQDLQDQMTMKGIEGPWNTNERLLVAVSYSPYSGRLIRATRRMAYNLEAPWIALYVDIGESLRPDDAEMLRKNVTLARELGAEVITIKDTDLTSGIQRICREKNVTQIIMGRPDRRFIRDFLARGTLLDHLVGTSSKIDVHVIRAERRPRYRGFNIHWPEFKTGFFPYYNVAWFLAAVTFACYMILPLVGYKAIGPMFLLAILAVSSLGNRGPILFAAVASTLIWDFLFIPPQFTFMITSSEDIMMVVSFFVTAVVGGFLTSRIRKQEDILQSREGRAQSLYELSKRLSASRTTIEVNQVLENTVGSQFQGRTRILHADKEGQLQSPTGFPENEFAVAHWTFQNRKPAGWSTQTLSAAPCLSLPMLGESSVIGVVLLEPKTPSEELSLEQENFIETVIAQASLALERLKFHEAAQAAKLYEASESLHQTLLNSISHEMRTPLTVIMGSATALADPQTKRDVVSVAQDLLTASDRLNRVIENLLDMSRLNSGVLALKTEWCDVHDLVHAAIQKLGVNLKYHTVKTEFAADLPLVNIDFRLFEHALSNLILNAAAYTPKGTSIKIGVSKISEKLLSLGVCDQGPGIPVSDRERVFDKFYRVPGTPAGGTGLGLSIVKSIVEAHHGRVRVENGLANIGACFIIEMPISPVPPLPEGFDA